MGVGLIRRILTVQIEGLGGCGVNVEGAIGSGGERNKVMSVAFSERWVMNKRG